MKITVSDFDSSKTVDVAPDEVFVFGVEKLNCSQRKGQHLVNTIRAKGYEGKFEQMLNIIWNMTDKEFEEIMKKRV